MSRLPARYLLIGLPLIAIALLAGVTGYATKETRTSPVPPLPGQEASPRAISGSIQSLSGNDLRITLSDGSPLTLRLHDDAPIEVLRPISVDLLRPGDWINGGAISHRQSVLALTGLVLISKPVLETP